MSAPPKGALAWYAKAEGDLLNIQNNLACSKVPWETLVFHAHQAAEKYLKGLLAAHSSNIAKTHDLAALIRECSRFLPALSGFEFESAAVSALYLSSRYPETTEPTEADARRALALALKIKAAVVGNPTP